MINYVMTKLNKLNYSLMVSNTLAVLTFDMKTLNEKNISQMIVK